MATDHAVAEQPTSTSPESTSPEAGSAPGPDLGTTAGKLADLKRRVAEVANAGSERAVEK